MSGREQCVSEAGVLLQVFFMAQAGQGMGKDEQIGFHKGALSTLAKERQELLRLVQIVEQLMQMHVKALKELGIDLEKEAESLSQQGAGGAGAGGQGQGRGGSPDKPIEDILK
ncbi:hypothetical protein D6783_03295 [Candidatus Woesearchaeota archaeon]|nr:MAG: hypothetical protein D6783_03295 [Candidatus Woesearchaeota archaeon]